MGVILCYHSVRADWDDALAVRPGDFAQQCAWLARHRDVVPTTQLADRTARSARSAVALTFDDGFADFRTEALPVLRQHGLPATMYLVAETLTDGAAGGATWLRPPVEPPPPTLTRDEVLELQDLGVDFGSHSWAHRDLRTLSEEECERDLRESRELLEDLLRAPVPTLAYPYGFHAPHVRRAAVAAGYRYALTLPESGERLPGGPAGVPRVGIYRENSMRTFDLKSRSWYLSLRTSPVRRALSRLGR